MTDGEVHGQGESAITPDEKSVVHSREGAKSRTERLDFKLERNNHQIFFGREDILAELDEWLAHNDRGWFLLQSLPGFGKTAVLNAWLGRLGDRGQPCADHFIRWGGGECDHPASVQVTLAERVELLFPAQRDVHASPKTRLKDLLGRVSPVLLQRRQKLVLLVDGVGEVRTRDGLNPLPDMLPPTTFAGILVVVGACSADPHLEWFRQHAAPLHEVNLNDSRWHESNIEAVRAYWVSRRAQVRWPLSNKRLQQVVDASGGNFLHAVKQFECWENSEVEPSEDSIVVGLDGLFEDWWHRLEQAPREERVRVMEGLALLCAAKEPLSLEMLEEQLQWKSGEGERNFLPYVQEMLSVDPSAKPMTYRFVHEALADFLRGKLCKDVANAHRSLLDYAAWPFKREGDWARQSYTLRHRVAHLLDVNKVDEAVQTCRNVAYLKAKAQGVGIDAVDQELQQVAVATKDHEIRYAFTRVAKTLMACLSRAHVQPESIPEVLHNRLLGDSRVFEKLLWPAHDLRLPLLHSVRLPSTACTLRGHPGLVSAITVLPDDRIVFASSDQTLRIWDPFVGRATLTLCSTTGSVMAVAVLPNGCIASGSSDGTVRVWDVSTGRSTHTLCGHTGSVTAIAVLPDGRVVSGSSDQTLRVWDVSAGRSTHTLCGHTGSVTAIAVLPDGRVVSGSSDQTLRVWDVSTGRSVHTLRGHTGSVMAVSAMQDGRVASGSSDQTLRVWNVFTGQSPLALKGHTGSVSAVASLPDGLIVSGSSDQTLRVWDPFTAQSYSLSSSHQSSVNAIVVLPDGRIVVACSDETLRVCDPYIDRSFSRFGHTGPVSKVASLPDGGIISGSSDGALRSWDLSTGRSNLTFRGHTGSVTAIAGLPDGRIVSGSSDGTVRVWEPSMGHPVLTLKGHTGPVMAVAVLPGGHVVSGSLDKTLRIWDLSKDRSSPLLGHTGPVMAVVVLPDGRVVSGSSDQTLRAWDPSTGRSSPLSGHTGSVTVVAVLFDGRVVSGSSDQTLRVWDPLTGRSSLLAGHTGSVRAVAILPDGGIVSGSDDHTLHIWNPSTGQSRLLCGHTSPVTSVAVLPGGRVVSSSDDQTLRVWDVNAATATSTVYGVSAFGHVLVAPRRIVAGDTMGNIWILDATRLWHEVEFAAKESRFPLRPRQRRF